MAAAPICITCNLERTLVSIQPARNRHDVQHYECPKCKGAFRLVVQRTLPASDGLLFDFPARQAVVR